MINDDMERLANRGSHQDPAAVIDAAFSTAQRSAQRRLPVRPLVAAAAVFLVGGLVAVLALVADTPNPPTLTPPAPLPITTTAGPTPTSLAPTVSAQVACPTVEFGWSDPPADIDVIAETIRSNSIGGTIAGYQIATDPIVFMARGQSLENDTALLPEQQAEIVPVTVAGIDTKVLPPATGVGGQNVSFVFPASAPADDPCNQWVINANTPMDTDVFVALVESLDMNQTELNNVDSTDVGATDGRTACGIGQAGTLVRSWASDTADVSLTIAADNAVEIRVTDRSGEIRQTCMDASTAAASLSNGSSLSWVGPVDDGVLIAIAHPADREIKPLGDLTHLGPVASPDQSDFELSIYTVATDDQLPTGTSTINQLSRLIQQARTGITAGENSAPIYCSTTDRCPGPPPHAPHRVGLKGIPGQRTPAAIEQLRRTSLSRLAAVSGRHPL